MTNSSAIGLAPRTLLAGRFPLILAGLATQITIGSLFAWSVFLEPLHVLTGLDRTSLLVPYRHSLVWFTIGLLLGAQFARRQSPRALARLGGLLMVTGTLCAALASPDLSGITIGIGVLGGLGAGLAYLAPVSTFQHWLPGNKGIFVGLSVLSFGLGAILAAPLLRWLIGGASLTYGETVPFAFLAMSSLFLVGVVVPGEWLPSTRAWLAPRVLKTIEGEPVSRESTLRQRWESSAVPLLRLWLCWAVFFAGSFAGIVGLQSRVPLLKEVHWHEAWLAAGICVAVLAVTNRFGRTAWAAVSARVGQGVALLSLILVSAALSLIFTAGQPQLTPALATLALLGFGGGGFLGLMPQLAAEMLDAQEGLPLRYAVMFSAFGLCTFGAPFWLYGLRPATLSGAISLLAVSGGFLVGFLYLLCRPSRTGSPVSQALARW